MWLNLELLDSNMKDVLFLLGAVLLGYVLAVLISRRRARGQITALVFLLKEPRPLADWQVRQAAARASMESDSSVRLCRAIVFIPG